LLGTCDRQHAAPMHRLLAIERAAQDAAEHLTAKAK
jgi:hypothetical protein